MDHNLPTMETVRPSLIRSKENGVKEGQCRNFAFQLPREEIKRLRNFSQSVLLYGKVDCVEVRLSFVITHCQVEIWYTKLEFAYREEHERKYQ